MSDSQHQPRFFLTHSSKDGVFARRLADDLRSRGLEGFLDVYAIQPGDNIADRISRGLDECDVYLPIMSDAALRSPWCLDEINSAVTLSNEPGRRGRPRIISILVEDCHSEIPVLLRSRLYINFSGRYNEALEELLCKGLKLQKPQPAFAPTVKVPQEVSPIARRPANAVLKPVRPSVQASDSSLFDKLLGVISFDSGKYFNIAKDQAATGQAAFLVVIFRLVSGFFSGLVSVNPQTGGAVVSVVGAVVAAILTVIVGLIAWVISAWVLAFVAKAFGGKTDTGEMLRVTGYVEVFSLVGILAVLGLISPALLCVVGIISLVAAILRLIGYVIGVREAAEFSTTNAIITAIIAAVVNFIIFAVIYGVLFAAVAVAVLVTGAGS